MEVVDVFNGVHSISTAKILVITKKKERIDKKVKVVAEYGSGVVWVKESQSCACLGNINGDDGEHEVESYGQVNCRMGGQSMACHAPYENNNEGVVEDEDIDGEGSEEDDELEEDTVNVVDDDAAHYENFEEQYGVNCMQNQNNAMQKSNGQQVAPRGAEFEDHQQLSFKNICGHEKEFDPILSIEVGNSLRLAENTADYTPSTRQRNGRSQIRSRGRPKRVAQSLPEPLYVPSTPTYGPMEPVDTWDTVKRLGVETPNDGIVVSALRRSRRLLAKDDANPVE